MSETDFSTDQYSKSLFVIEVDGTPTVIFKNKRHAEAELICQTWKNNHWEQLLIEGRGKLVSEDVAQEVRHRCDLQRRDVPECLQAFTDRYEGRYRDVQLPLPIRMG
jgi:hypothetical protein